MYVSLPFDPSLFYGTPPETHESLVICILCLCGGWVLSLCFDVVVYTFGLPSAFIWSDREDG